MSTHQLRSPKFSAFPLILSATTIALTTLGVGSVSASPLNDSVFNKPNPTRKDLALQAYLWGWPLLNVGNYGTNYLLRAAVAQFGIAAHVPEEALYFIAQRDVLGNPLTGAKSYRISFAADNLPPVDPNGFWSLTLYNSAGFLVDNVINRYSLGSNTPLQYNADGSLDLYLGNTVPTSAKELANWLPTPKGNFNLALRTYLPSATLLNRAYRTPGIQPVPEPASVLGLLALGTLGTGVTLKRKLKSSQSGQKS